jgi:Rps23 Pro-64 3,4-dihydroxylase Tpa1-like proline 4-hydroxylase
MEKDNKTTTTTITTTNHKRSRQQLEQDKKMKGLKNSQKRKKKLSQRTPIIEDDSLFEKYINPQYIGSKSDLTELNRQYKSGKPFSHIRLRNFFSDEQFLLDLFSEMEREKYVEKSNDLYSFLQTKRDLRSVLLEEQDKKKELSNISKLCKVLYSKGFRDMIQTITGLDVQLNQTIDMSGACYRDTAHLLCHDDELEGRRVAYILYFVDKNWSKEDGGCLELFNVDSNGQPDKVETSLVPEWNSFVFFEVTPTSFHQVAEVLQDDRFRVSISGWFHGPPIKRPPPYIEEPIENSPISTTELEEPLLQQWINDTYLNPDTQEQIKEAFAEQCSVELQQFLKPEKYALLLQAMKKKDLKWNMVGPANRRHYEKMDMSGDIDPIIRECVRLFQSKEFVQYLAHTIDVDVTSVNVQGRKFSSGCYTLVHNQPMDETRLDAILCLTGKDWDFDFGGQIVYMDEEEELLSVLPQENSLSLVLRDKGTMQFIKYVNHQAPEDRIDLSFVYEAQVSSDEEEEEDSEENEEENNNEEEGVETAEE